MRGNAISIKGLPKSLQYKFRRAVALSGAKSISSWLFNAVRREIREQEEQYGDLMLALTPDERDILKVIKRGANDPEHIIDETKLPPKQLESILADLVDRGILDRKKQGGKTESARGARRPLYFVVEK